MKETSKTRIQVWRWHRGLICFVLSFSLLIGCSPENSKTPKRVFRSTREMMATYVTLTVAAEDERQADDAIEAGFGEIERLARLLSWWDKDSELSRVNREAAEAPVHVSPEVLELTRIALEIAKITDGAFDPTAGPLIRLWNVTKATVPPDTESIAQARERVGYQRMAIEGDAIRFLEKGVEFSLGGIAKGYMADRVVAVLKARGIQDGLVAVAGDIRAFGLRPDGKPWRVGIQDPRSEGLILELDLRDGAVSTSGDYERFFEYEGRRYHHILDPGTGYPARGAQGVTVVHERAVMADGLATGLFAMGPEKALGLMGRLSIRGVIVDEDHKTIFPPGSADIFSPPRR